MIARRRVVHFFATLERGGAEMRTLELMRAVGPEASDHRIVTLARAGGALAADFEAVGVRNVYVRAKSLRFPWELRKQLAFARAVHVHLGTLGGPIIALAWLFRVPVRIAHFRSDAQDGTRSWAARIVETAFKRLITMFATDIVGVSPSALTSGYRNDWSRDPRCRVLLSGLDLEPYDDLDGAEAVQQLLGLPRFAPVVLHLGRDHPAKNRGRAIDIFRRVVASRPDAHLVFVGRTLPESQAIQLQKVRGTALEGRVHWAGEREDVPSLLRSATVTLMTSTREGMPGSVLESVAAGTPVVGTDLPGCQFIREIFDRDVTLLNLDDEDAAWADEVVKLLAEPPSTSDRLAALHRVRASHFNRDECVQAFLDLWRSRG